MSLILKDQKIAPPWQIKTIMGSMGAEEPTISMLLQDCCTSLVVDSRCQALHESAANSVSFTPKCAYSITQMATADASFDQNGLLFAHISSDCRLHLWDVASKKEKKSYVDKDHLTHTLTCYEWSRASSNQPGLFASGYSDGVVVIFDLNRGVVAKTIGKKLESEVSTGIVFSNDSKSVFVSSNDNHVVQYDVASGTEITKLKTGKKGVQRIAMNSKVDVIAVASSSAVKIIDIASGRKRKLDASFSGGVSALIFTPCGRFLAASSTRTREILVFDIRANATTEAPVYVLAVKGVVTAIDAKCSKNKDAIQLLGIFEDAGACVFELDANYGQLEAASASGVRSQTHVVSNHAIVAGRLGNSGNRDDAGVLLAVGSKSSPVFRYVDLASAVSKSGVEKEIVLKDAHLVSESAAQVNGTKTAQEGTLFAPEVLGPHEMGGLKRPIVSTGEVTASDDSEKAKAKKSKTNGNSLITPSSNPQELSLEQRLESLSNSLVRLEEKTDGANSKTSVAAPTSDSLVTLIDQALQSGDDALLEQCLSCADMDIVEATARRLPTGRIVLFLRKLVAKFEKRPSRGILLTQWLSALLRHHTAFLVTVPDLSYQLAGLSQMLEQRLSSYSKLSSLAGRLDLLMSQVDYRSNSVTDPDGSAAAARQLQDIVPMQVYMEE